MNFRFDKNNTLVATSISKDSNRALYVNTETDELVDININGVLEVTDNKIFTVDSVYKYKNNPSGIIILDKKPLETPIEPKFEYNRCNLDYKLSKDEDFLIVLDDDFCYESHPRKVLIMGGELHPDTKEFIDEINMSLKLDYKAGVDDYYVRVIRGEWDVSEIDYDNKTLTLVKFYTNEDGYITHKSKVYKVKDTVSLNDIMLVSTSEKFAVNYNGIIFTLSDGIIDTYTDIGKAGTMGVVDVEDMTYLYFEKDSMDLLEFVELDSSEDDRDSEYRDSSVYTSVSLAGDARVYTLKTENLKGSIDIIKTPSLSKSVAVKL